MKHKKNMKYVLPIFIAAFFLTSCGNIKQLDYLSSNKQISNQQPSSNTVNKSITETITQDKIPEYSGEPDIVINDNQPDFSEEELTTDSYESYSERDSLGRSQAAEACISTDVMPTEKRGSIGQVKPSGWHTVKYDNIDGMYLYNRCHLIGYQLTGENANEENLITGTRSLNVDGMLPYENQVADYVKETENHVMYRVTPIYQDNDLVASGVQMEGKSVEDEGEGVCFNVYVYNVQPGITIDYTTGESVEADDSVDVNSVDSERIGSGSENRTRYILNKNTHKFHDPECASVTDIKSKNKKEYWGDRTDLIEQGDDPCNRCNP